MLSELKSLIPGAEYWPKFIDNFSEQYEARLSLVEVLKSPSLFLSDMSGSRIPIVVAHGEGRAFWEEENHQQKIKDEHLTCMRFIENTAEVANTYPANPNGSPQGLTGFTSRDGRVTILMPHPERLFRQCQFSWYPETATEDSPWMRLFRNARVYVD